MSNETANPPTIQRPAAAGEVTLSKPAEVLLDRYLAQIKSLARGLRSVSIEELIVDVREHVYSSLRGEPAPITAPQMHATLQRVGAAEQWLPLDELPPWRSMARRMLSSPRLPYIAFALLVVGAMLPLAFAAVLMLASFCLARAAMSQQERPENHWQRWLTYPPLVVLYSIALCVLFFWPLAATVGRPWADLGLPAWMLHRIESSSPNQNVPVSAAVAAFGIWTTILGLIFTAQPAMVRAALYPFADRISRWGTILLALAGALTTVVGALILPQDEDLPSFTY